MSDQPQPDRQPNVSPAGAASPTLHTIGYGARSLDELVTALKAHRIEYLLDVRSSPYSKFKPEFTKEALEAALKVRGIRYVFVGDTLGGQPRDPDCYADGKVDYEKVRQQPFFQAGLERLRKAHEQRLRAALMCSEGRPEQCHRSKMIGEALAAAGIPVWHIDEDGQLLTQTQSLCRPAHGLPRARCYRGRFQKPSARNAPPATSSCSASRIESSAFSTLSGAMARRPWQRLKRIPAFVPRTRGLLLPR